MVDVRHLVFTICTLCLCAKGYAQEKCTFNKCVLVALGKRPELLNNSSFIMAGREQLASMKWQWLPNLTSSQGLLYLKGRNPNLYTNRWEESRLQQAYVSIQSQATLFGGTRWQYSLKQQQAQLLEAREYARLQSMQIRQEVAHAYYSLVSSKLKVLKEVDLSQDLEKYKFRLEGLVKHGKRTQIELLEIKSIIMSQQIAQQLAALEVLEAEAQLKRVSNDDYLSVDLNDMDLDTSLVDTGMVLGAHIPFYECQERRHFEHHRGTWYHLKQLKAMHLPQIYMLGTFTTLFQKNAIDVSNPLRSYDLENQLRNNKNLKLGLVFELPIINRQGNKLQIQKLKYEMGQSEIKYQYDKNMDELAFGTLMARWRHCVGMVGDLNDKLSLDKEVFEKRWLQYELGTSELSYLLGRLSQYHQSRLQVQQHKALLHLLERLLVGYYE